MDRELELYLITIEKYLKNMPVSERIDVIKELKSCIEELQLNSALSAKEIIERLGSPKELAAGYLSDNITIGHSISFKKLMMVFSFYSLTSLSGIFVIPCGTFFAGGLILCGIIGPMVGLVKTLGFFFGYDVPFAILYINGWQPHSLLAFPITVVLGVLFVLLGRTIWKAVISYIRKVSNIKRTLERRA